MTSHSAKLVPATLSSVTRPESPKEAGHSELAEDLKVGFRAFSTFAMQFPRGFASLGSVMYKGTRGEKLSCIL